MTDDGGCGGSDGYGANSRHCDGTNTGSEGGNKADKAPKLIRMKLAMMTEVTPLVMGWQWP